MNDLPIDSILPELNQALSLNKNVILSAQPGAGKTTRVPLALLDAQWLRNDDGSYKKIIMLEPRRLAAKNAALFMAKSLGEAVGQTVGYRMRQDSKVSAKTRIEVITEGILTRYLLEDPELNNIGLIIFDEHHERSVNTDLGLALSLQCQDLFREDLKLLVMSATLEKRALEELLGAKTLFCAGRSFPVEHFYLGFDPKKRLSNQVTHAILNALQKHDGSILVFLPGIRDILSVQNQLHEKLSHSAQVAIHTLYGQLTDKDQQQAIQPPQEGMRKIVLSTNIAESSLTIEGIRIVIDSGLEKQMSYNPRSGMNSLITKKISQASSIQRSGRAGRLEAGICYRLWHEQEQNSRPAHDVPEICRIELSDLLLSISQWGSSADELNWLTPPPSVYITQAKQLLQQLELIDNQCQITSHGESASQLGLHPRFSHMMLNAQENERDSAKNNVALLSALITDTPKVFRNIDDLNSALAQFKNNLHEYPNQRKQAESWLKKMNKRESGPLSSAPLSSVAWSISQLLALAFPDRIAQKRKNTEHQYLLRSGRGAELSKNTMLTNEEWLVIVDIEDNLQGGSLIRKAIAISEAEVISLFNDGINTQSHIEWNSKGQLIAEEQKCLGSIVLESKKIAKLSNQQWLDAWRNYFHDNGISSLPWSADTEQLRVRMQFASHFHQNSDSPWPNFTLESLTEHIDEWLMPLLHECHSLKALQKLDIKTALMSYLGWQRQETLEALVPERIKVPSGSFYRIDYSQNPPVLAVKLQEMFGYQGKPSICNGQVSLMLHLLSPAQRPLQITQDLPYFWKSSYLEIRKEMRGRYPKHPWPEDPMNTQATGLTKKRLGI